MSTKANNSILDGALANIPKIFRDKLIQTYLEVKRGQAESKFESAGLSAGKFCEVAVRLLQHEITGSYIAFGKKIPDMADECRKLITAKNIDISESIKIIIPRAIVFLYTMRNKRGIGHIGGDIDANNIDTMAISRNADWIICELIRVYHKLPLEEAQDLIDSISVRSLPIVWEVAGRKRVLKEGLSAKQKVLVLLYSESDAAVLMEDLCAWVEYTPAMFSKRVLDELHKNRLIEYDKDSELVYLSPKGAKLVEDELL